MDNQKFQEAQSEFFFTWVFLAFAALVAFLLFKVKQARKRNPPPPHQSPYVPRQKIIIALEINQFLVKYSNRPKHGYLPLPIILEHNWLTKWVKETLKIGHYYKPLFAMTKIKDFVQGLAEIKKVEVMIYSSMRPYIVEAILGKLQINRLIPLEKRKFCDLDNDDDQKHAIQVDQDSRRVLIITPSHDDHSYEDQKYFLVIKPKIEEPNFLKDTLRFIKSFVEANNDLNILHEQLSEVKINLQSDWSDYD